MSEVTWSLSALLAAGVRPRPGDELATLIARAEQGSRIAGAIALAAAWRELSPAAAARAIAGLERSLLSTWGRITRDAIQHLPPGHALSSWRAWLSPDPVRGARGLDRWVTDYETSLRHAGRASPRSMTGALCAQLAGFLDVMCERLAAPEDLVIEALGPATVVRCGDEAWPTSPFLEIDAGVLSLWDTSSGGSWHWLAYVLRGSGLRPEPRSRPRAQAAGIHPELARRAADAPLRGLLAATDGLAPPVFDDRLAVLLVPEIEPVERVELLAERWRGRHRAVLTVPIEPDDDPLDQIAARVVVKAESAHAALMAWRERDAELEVVVAVAGRPRSVAPMVAAWRALRGAARLVIVTETAHAHGLWSLNERRELRFVHDEVTDPHPLAVSARLAAGMSAGAAWQEAALATFALDHPDAFDDLVALARGADLLERPNLQALWSRGLIAITGDGAAHLAHPGWSALAAGLAGLAMGSHDRAAWQAGWDLAAERGNG